MADSTSIRKVEQFQRGKRNRLQKKGKHQQQNHLNRHSGSVKIVETRLLNLECIRPFPKINDARFVVVSR
jgi:hypothetical protein